MSTIQEGSINLQNLGYLLQYMLTNSLSGFTVQFVDSSNATHPAQVVFFQNPNTYETTVIATDSSSTSYTPVSFQMIWNGVVYVNAPITGITKTSTTILMYEIVFLPSSKSLPVWLLQEFMYVLVGQVQSKSFSVSASATVTEYSTSGSTCTTTVSSTSSVSPSISYSPSNNELVIELSYSLSQCETLTIESLTISDGLGNSFSWSCPNTSSNCTSTECGYGATCSVTYGVDIIVS